MKLWKKILIGILILLIIAFGSLIFLLGTTIGLHLLIDIIVYFIPGLSIKEIEGNWNSLVLKEVQYERTGIIINASEFHISTRLDYLKNATFCIDYLQIKDIKGIIKSSKIHPILKYRNSSDKIIVPYPIILRYVSLHNVNFAIDNSTISILHFDTGIHWKDQILTLTSTRIHDCLISIFNGVQNIDEKSIRSEIFLKKKFIGERLQKVFNNPIFPISLTDFHIPINLNIEEVFVNKLHFIFNKIDLLMDHLLLKVSIRNDLIQLQTLEISSNYGEIIANGKVQLIDNWSVDLILHGVLNFDASNVEKIYLVLNGSLRQQIQLALDISGPLNAKLNICTSLASTGLPIQLKLSSSNLRWPLTGTSQYQINNLSFNLTGKVTNYQLSLNSMIKSRLIPFSNLTIHGRGNTKQFSLNRLRLVMLKGYADFKGIVHWNKGINWNSELILSHISAILPYSDLPITLIGKMITRGHFYENYWQVHIPNFQMRGKIKQSEIYVNGTLNGNSSNHWNIPGVNLVLYHNDININKTDILKRAFKINILSKISSVIDSVLKSSNLLEKYKMLSLYTDHTKKKSKKINCNRLVLNINGNEKKHQLKLQINNTSVFGSILLNGSFNAQQNHWKGIINHTVFSTCIGKWRLRNPIKINYINNNQTVIIDSHCWDNPHVQICFSQPIVLGSIGHIRISLNRFDLVMLRPFLPVGIKVVGTLIGQAYIKWHGEKLFPTGYVSINGYNLNIQNTNRNAFPVSFNMLTFSVDLFERYIDISWLVHVFNNGQFNGKIQIRDLQNYCNLSGEININNFLLKIVNVVLLNNVKISGALNSVLQIRGNLQQPKIYGQIELYSINIENESIPIDSIKGSLNILLTGTNLTLEGIIQTTDGKINLYGNANWNYWNNWHIRIIARGNHIRITVPPIVRMDISPDLVFEASPISFNLNGRVNIPWMRIIVQNIPKSTISISPDEVLIDKNLNPISSKKSSFPINSNLNIYIGDDVHINAFGLQAKLTGNLKLIHDKHNFNLNGQIDIPVGRFYTYGQDLLIRKGELHFSGSPNHPYINLESVRNPAITEDGVIVGFRITGQVDNLKAEIFSEPPMIYQEMISYLFRGQGLSTDSDNNALASLLITLGISQSKQVVNKVGQLFGVKNLSIDTTGVGDNQQIQISGYIFPTLQVKYGIGIFDLFKKTFTLRYRLAPQLYLEAISGLNQTINLLYQFEF